MALRGSGVEVDPRLLDFRHFLTVAWQRLGLPKPTPIQYDFAHALQYGIDPTRPAKMAPNNRMMLMGFRGVAKSWMTSTFVPFCLRTDPDLKIEVVSASKSLADDISTFIWQLIELMPELRHLAPKSEQRRSKIEFDVGPARASKDPSVKSVGIFGQVVGSRAGLIIADDIETDQNSITQGSRERLRAATKQLEAVIVPGGRIVYLGTPQYEQSFYNILQRERGYTIRRWPARYPDPASEGIHDIAAELARLSVPEQPRIEAGALPGRGDLGARGEAQELADGVGAGLDAQGIPGSLGGVPLGQEGRIDGGSPVGALDQGAAVGIGYPQGLGQPASDYWRSLSPRLKWDVLKDPSLIGKPTDASRFDELELRSREAAWGRSGFLLQYGLDTRLTDANRYPLRLSDLIVADLDLQLAPEKFVWGRGPHLEIDGITCVGFDGDRYYRPQSVSEKLVPYQGSILFVDPSGRGQDETAWAVAKVLNGQIVIPEVRGLTGGYENVTLESIAESAKIHKCNLILVEPNFGDGMFQRLLVPVLNKVYPGCGIEDAPRAAGQKEKRIIDVLEPAMNQHRLVIGAKVFEQDSALRPGLGEDKALRYQLAYQLTRITRERGCLAHDDRIDALAGAVRYWIDRMARDVDDEVRSARERLRDEALANFQGMVFGKQRTPPGPTPHGRMGSPSGPVPRRNRGMPPGRRR